MSPAPKSSSWPGWAVPYEFAATIATTAALVWTTPYMAAATFSYAGMLAGLLIRKRRVPHVALMVSAIAIDLVVVLALEAQRDAVATALEFSLTTLRQAHVIFSAAAVALYFPVVVLGWLRYTGRSRGPATRVWHIRLGVTAFVLRSLGFILMFSML